MKRTPIRKISDKMVSQKKQEKEITLKLLERCKGLCEDCGQFPDWRGLSKHEVVFRSHGGSATDPANCLMLCGICHDKRHGIVTFKPYSKEMQIGKKHSTS